MHQRGVNFSRPIAKCQPIGFAAHATLLSEQSGAARRPDQRESLSPDNRRSTISLHGAARPRGPRDSDGPGGDWGSHPVRTGRVAGGVIRGCAENDFTNSACPEENPEDSTTGVKSG